MARRYRLGWFWILPSPSAHPADPRGKSQERRGPRQGRREEGGRQGVDGDSRGGRGQQEDMACLGASSPGPASGRTLQGLQEAGPRPCAPSVPSQLCEQEPLSTEDAAPRVSSAPWVMGGHLLGGVEGGSQAQLCLWVPSLERPGHTAPVLPAHGGAPGEPCPAWPRAGDI